MLIRIAMPLAVMTLTAVATSTVVAITAAPAPAHGDEIYLCDGAVSAIVVPTGARATAARDQPCVQSWNAMRRREELKRLAEISDPYRPARGVTSRDFCHPSEPCHLPMPRWSPRWDYTPSRGRHITVYWWSR